MIYFKQIMTFFKVWLLAKIQLSLYLFQRKYVYTVRLGWDDLISAVLCIKIKYAKS